MGTTLDSLPPRYRAQAEAQLSAPRRPPSLVQAPRRLPHREGGGGLQGVEGGFAPKKRPSRRRRHPIMDVESIGCEARFDGARRCVFFTFDINPAMIPTAQQKGIDFKHGIVYTKAHVRHVEELFRKALAPFAHLAAPLAGRPLFVMAQFHFAYPKGARASERVDGRYNTRNGDADNYWKGIGDSFTAAGVWGDDREIALLGLAKRRTTSRPRVEVAVAPAPDPDDLFSFLRSAPCGLTAQDAQHTATMDSPEAGAPRTTAAAFRQDLSRSSADGEVRTV